MTIIETNFPDLTTTERLVGELLANRLIACANWWPIESRYWWQGEQKRSQEVRCVFKTTADKRDAALAWLHDHHPYDAPWLTHADIPSVSTAYSRWLQETVQ